MIVERFRSTARPLGTGMSSNSLRCTLGGVDAHAVSARTVTDRTRNRRMGSTSWRSSYRPRGRGPKFLEARAPPVTRRPVWVTLVALLALGGLAVLAHRPLLRAASQALVVDDPRERADAIVVVAGSTPSREETAAGLFRTGWAPRVLVSRQFVPGRVQRLIDMGIRRLDFQGESVAALERY